MATQGERRAETRQRLLDAAAELFAERGIEAASVDAIAERAQRTSGAVYDHFESKEGLLFALLEGWVDDVAIAIGAEVATATTLDERLASLWRNVTNPPSRDHRWLLLEHEMWSYAARNEGAREQLARRYNVFWDGLEGAMAEWTEDDDVGEPRRRVGPALVGLLLGLEMMRRVDPDALTDEMAIAALRGVVTSTTTGVHA